MRATSTPSCASVSSSAARPAQRDDGAGADQELDALDQDAGRHDVQRELRLADLDRVPGIVAAAEPRDDAVVAREQVDDAPLALVAPLNADADVEGAPGLGRPEDDARRAIRR